MDNILKFLPEFKVVEPNRLTGLVTGHVLSQFPLAADSTLIKDVNGKVNVIENGAIVGLNAGLLVDAYDAKTMGHPFLVFTEELNTTFDGLKFFATAEDADGEIYPRGVALYTGDAFTTNNYAKAGAVAPKFAKVVAGVLTLQDAADAATMFAVEEAITPLGELAYKFIYFGLTAAVFAAAAAKATAPAIATEVETALAAELQVGGDIDSAIGAAITAELQVGGDIDSAIGAAITAELQVGGDIDSAIGAAITAELQDDRSIDSAIKTAVADHAALETGVHGME